MYHVVNVPVTNLRREPTQPKENIHFERCLSYEKDSDQETQLLYNEIVKIIYVKGEWAYVEVQEQFHKGSSKYKGWVPKKDLLPSKNEKNNHVFVTSLWAIVLGEKTIQVSFGTGFQKISQNQETTEVILPGGGKGTVCTGDLLQKSMTFDARKFIHSPYLWGGRSAFDPKHQQITSVDCSGLISLLYRVKGINLPRNAVDQWKICHPISQEKLVEGDLVFSSSKGGVDSIDHVMLHTGNGKIIESAMGVGKVQEITLDEKKSQFPDDEFFYGRFRG